MIRRESCIIDVQLTNQQQLPDAIMSVRTKTSFKSHLRRLVYVSTHVFIFASSIPTDVCPSDCSSSSSWSRPGSPERGSSRGTRDVQVEMALKSSSSARYRGTCRAISKTAERKKANKWMIKR